MSEQRGQKDWLLDTPIPPLIIRLGIPGVISMMVTTIYNMVDTWFVARLGTQAVAACGVTLSIMEMMMSVGYWLGTGGALLIGMLLGAQKKEEANRVGSTAFFVTLMIGSAFAALGIAFLEPLMRFLGSSETILPYAKDYGFFILLGFPVMSGSLVMNAILRNEGKMKRAMLGIASGSVLNMILDPIFIFFLDMGISGAALATFISQLAGFLLMLFFFVSGQTRIKLSLRRVSLRRGVMGRIMLNGLPSLTRHGVVMVANTAMNIAAGAVGGDALIAGLSLAGKVMSLVMAVVKGWFQGSTTVFAYNKGAGRHDRVRSAYRFSLGLDLAVAAAIATFILFAAEGVISIFTTTDPQVTAYGSRALRMQAIALFAMPVGFASNQLLQAVGEAFKSTLLAAMPQGIFYIPAVFLLPIFFGADGVMAAPIVGYGLTALATVPVVRSYFKGGPCPHPLPKT